MSDEGHSPQDYRRGIPASRKNLWVARISAERFLACGEKDHDGQILYGGAFFMFLRSAIYALKFSDGRDDPLLREIAAAYFQDTIKVSDVFKTIEDERNNLAHGNDSYAIHPSKPLGLLERADKDYGIDWADVVFEETWPFPPFKGQPISVVINACWRQVSDWLDEVDIRHERAWRNYRLKEQG